MPTIHSTIPSVLSGPRPAPIVSVRLVTLVAAACATVALSCVGCTKSLFPENQPRTQFEAYEIMRQRYVPLEEPDVFGTPRPAIRARLTPER